MEGFFKRFGLRKRVPGRNTIRLVIESLETRELLAGGIIAAVPPRAGVVRTAGSDGLDRGVRESLKIVKFAGIEDGPNIWTFRGKVVGSDVAGLEVHLGGIPSLVGTTVVVNPDGWFHVTVRLKVRESGTATAQVTDRAGNTSNLARTPVYPTTSFIYVDPRSYGVQLAGK